jgi:hypothetical protein
MPARLPRLLLAPVVALVLLPVAPAAAKSRTCASSDLRYPFQAGGPKDFGVFRLKITGASCPTAHAVAKAWMTRFEKNLRGPGKLHLPRHVKGYTFKTLPPNAAQTYRLRGTNGAKTLRFDYVVPNG